MQPKEIEIRKEPTIEQEQLRAALLAMGTKAEKDLKDRKWAVPLAIGIPAFVILILTIGIIAGGGYKGIIDTGSAKRSFNCTSDSGNDTIRAYTDAKIFTELYNGTCELNIAKGLL